VESSREGVEALRVGSEPRNMPAMPSVIVWMLY